nr:shikimate kinase [uncultured Cohaesibacter sp.]
MARHVLLFDGPIGVGKSTLGKAVAGRLGFAFIDGDDHCKTERWLASSLRTNQSIASASSALLERFSGVIVAYPVRRTNWIFFRETFARSGHCCHCIGLIAGPDHIARRERQLSQAELTRSAEMIEQGYGQRPFSTLVFRTDEGDLEESCARLTVRIRDLLEAFRRDLECCN